MSWTSDASGVLLILVHESMHSSVIQKTVLYFSTVNLPNTIGVFFQYFLFRAIFLKKNQARNICTNKVYHEPLFCPSVRTENLLLTADQRTVKLVDLGLAREETLTEMMTAETGTYRWMAPEVSVTAVHICQYNSFLSIFANPEIYPQLYSTVTLRHGEKKHYNHKVDVYSFAIVLWELLHNRLPFEGMSNLQAAYAAAFKV